MIEEKIAQRILETILTKVDNANKTDRAALTLFELSFQSNQFENRSVWIDVFTECEDNDQVGMYLDLEDSTFIGRYDHTVARVWFALEDYELFASAVETWFSGVPWQECEHLAGVIEITFPNGKPF